MKHQMLLFAFLLAAATATAQDKSAAPKDTAKAIYKSETFEWHTEGSTAMLVPSIRQSVAELAKSLGWKEDELVVSLTVRNKYDQVPNAAPATKPKTTSKKKKKFE
jgi:hypothetical protein